MTGSERQAFVGLTLAAGIALAWAAFHVGSIFFLKIEGAGLAAAPFLVLAICWLNVGLFIVAHDAMHGSLAKNAWRAGWFEGNAAEGGRPSFLQLPDRTCLEDRGAVFLYCSSIRVDIVEIKRGIAPGGAGRRMGLAWSVRGG